MKYTEPGEYKLTYTATDACGNETTETRQVTVVDPSRFVWKSTENGWVNETSSEEAKVGDIVVVDQEALENSCVSGMAIQEGEYTINGICPPEECGEKRAFVSWDEGEDRITLSMGDYMLYC